MSDSLDDKLDRIVETAFAAKRPKREPGWNPGVNTERGEAVIGPLANAPTANDWREVLERANLNPDEFTVLEPVDVRTWDAAIGDGEVRTMRYFKAKIIRKAEADDLTAFAEHLRTRRTPGKRPRRSRAKHPASYVVGISDPQIGKGEPEDTAAMIGTVLDQLPDDIARLRDEGHRLDDFVIGWGGDGCEGVTGFYSYQTATIKGGFRKQMTVAREVAFQAIDTLVDHFPAGTGRIVFCASNHGEFRHNGRAITNPRTDNLDLIVGDMLELQLQGNPRFRNVDVINPGPDDDGNLAIAINCHGQIVGFTHGHQFEKNNGGGPPTERAYNWLKGQATHGRNVESVDVMLVGHYHHDTYKQFGDRYIQIMPPLDVGSVYWEEGTGQASVPGVIRFVARAGLRYPEHRRVLYPRETASGP
jgi:hypothetical protein